MTSIETILPFESGNYFYVDSNNIYLNQFTKLLAVLEKTSSINNVELSYKYTNPITTQITNIFIINKEETLILYVNFLSTLILNKNSYQILYNSQSQTLYKLLLSQLNQRIRRRSAVCVLPDLKIFENKPRFEKSEEVYTFPIIKEQTKTEIRKKTPSPPNNFVRKISLNEIRNRRRLSKIEANLMT